MDDLESELGIQGTRKKLKRDLRAEAMTRLEEAARTEADFENVVKCWDKLDENRERKERYHEVGRSEVPLEYGSAYGGSIFPAWMGGPNSRAIRQGRFLDVIFNCPHELHQMVGHPALSKTFRELDFEYKELLFFLVVRNWSVQSYAQALNQTDRNVRKKMTRLVNRIQGELYNRLNGKANLSQIEKEFLDEYENRPYGRREREVRCMKDLFKHASSSWVKYDRYEWKKDKNNKFYITPAPNAMPKIYDPLKEYQQMVLDALNVGLLIRTSTKRKIREAIMDFVTRYGLLGLMTALPTTPSFIDYKAVYLPTNHFIREEVMDTEKHLAHFFPFEKPDFYKKGKESLWNNNGDRTIIALAMTFRKEPEAQVMCFMRNYAERYDWLEQTFQDWSFTFLSSFLFYEEDEEMDEDSRDIYRQGMAAFGGIAPNYHIELWERPTIVWDFHSLLLAIQMMFSFMLADETSSLKLCRNCMKAFFAKDNEEDFCCSKCEAEYDEDRE